MTSLAEIQSWPREQLESGFSQREKQLAETQDKLIAASELGMQLVIEKNAAQSELAVACEDRDAAVLERDALRARVAKIEAACAEMREALDEVWIIEDMGYTPDDPESESGVSTCNKCEAVQPNQAHAPNCPQPVIEKALSTDAGQSLLEALRTAKEALEMTFFPFKTNGREKFVKQRDLAISKIDEVMK